MRSDPDLDRLCIDTIRTLAICGALSYVLADPPDGVAPQVLLIATGSEVHLCMQAFERLTQEGIGARVVSMPSWDIFELQDDAHKDAVLQPDS